MVEKTVYLDNAATSFPKPGKVLAEMIDGYTSTGVSPGRGSYDLATEAEYRVQDIREKTACFFEAPSADHVTFCANATDALNLAIQGILSEGDHVVSTRLEHNSVLRPLYHLKQQGKIRYDLVPFDRKGFVHPGDIASAIRPETRLVIVNHVSNVLGTVQPVEAIGRICKDKGVELLVDAAQSAGKIPVCMDSWNVSALAFTGHKSLFGPTGIGGLVVHPELDIQSTRFGGTGMDSKSPVHTQSWPHRLEAGTINLMGIMGLSAGLDYLESKGMASIHQAEMALLTAFVRELSKLRRITLFGIEDLTRHVGVTTLSIEGMDPNDVGAILDGDFNIQVRTGLHCAPLAHETLGLFPKGGVRFSPGPLTTEADMEHTITALRTITNQN